MKRFGYWTQKAWLLLLVAGSAAVLDQWTKAWARTNLDMSVNYSLLELLGVRVLLQRVNNYGSAFGLVQNQDILYPVLAAGFALALLLYVWYLPLEKRVIRVLLGLQLGGAVGNLLDRIYQGAVTDFVKIGVTDTFYLPNFNVADAAIACGVLGVIAYAMYSK